MKQSSKVVEIQGIPINVITTNPSNGLGLNTILKGTPLKCEITPTQLQGGPNTIMVGISIKPTSGVSLMGSDGKRLANPAQLTVQKGQHLALTVDTSALMNIRQDTVYSITVTTTASGFSSYGYVHNILVCAASTQNKYPPADSILSPHVLHPAEGVSLAIGSMINDAMSSMLHRLNDPETAMVTVFPNGVKALDFHLKVEGLMETHVTLTGSGAEAEPSPAQAAD
ncbi:MAG TPA: hypothetical protein VKU00_10580 [Chthonomonadaceae bacterium]|nr:hypothetical protein [Chthonomonadaceae bacterium]